jgi:hypothetical protein
LSMKLLQILTLGFLTAGERQLVKGKR